MFGSIFKKRKKPTADSNTIADSIVDAKPGDVFTISHYSLDLENSYLIIDTLNRYEIDRTVWFEIFGQDGNNELWLNWSNDGEIHVSAATSHRPIGLKGLGINEKKLVELDEDHSIDNYISHKNRKFYYQNSGEAFFFRNNENQGEGFYLWDFVSEDETKFLAVEKWEGVPFKGYFSDVIPTEDITVYKQ